MSEPLTPEQVKAGRALLAMSQQELAAAARVSPSTVADFERGSRTPVANNAQAIREALESRGIQFIAGGAVDRSLLPSPPRAPQPGALMRWVDATHLAQWGERRDGQADLPEVLRRLIYAAKGPAAAVRFPSGDSVHLPGWDGVCTIDVGDQFIPDGVSVWEIGARRGSVKGKADEDYVTRTTNPRGVDPAKTTLVHVTPRRFANKDVWEAEKRAEGVWRQVRVLDADDLVTWLEMYPAVAQWLAVKIGRRPKGLRNLEEAWAEWIRASETPLNADTILTDRDDDAAAVLKWAKDEPAILPIQADSPDEAIAFLYAAFSDLPEAYRLSYLSRCVVATDNETARDLIGVGSPLYVVATDPDPGLAQRLVDYGHHVYATIGSDATALTAARRLARPWAHGLKLALIRGGLAEQAAHQLARGAGRSVTVLRRIMPAALAYKPAWAVNSPPELVSAMLAGAWDEKSALDRRIVSALAGCAYEQVETALAPLAAMVGGPLIRSGSIWKIVSLRDLWTLVAPQLTTSQLARFEAAYHQVLGAVDPRFEATRNSTWFEREGEFGEEASPALRRGLAQTMIALGVYPDAAKGIIEPARHADLAITKLLSNADAKLWWSLSRDFRGLAEASPTAFLDAVDAALDGDDPPLMSLFRSDEGFLTRTEYLSELLWALEMLARSPDFLMRSALLLARLAEVDPGGSWGNRPDASLRRIFVTWSPQTYAPFDKRLKVIDAIVRRHPAAGWDLLVALAPRSHDSSEPSPQPDWRDFTPDGDEEQITWAAVWEAARAIGERLLAQVDSDGARWRTLLSLWANFEPAWRGEAAKQLETYARALDDPPEREALRDELRGLLQKHRSFADAQWAMAEKELAPLDAIFQGLEAISPAERHRWLFRPNHDRLRPNMSFENLEAELEVEHAAAADELLKSLSVDELFAFARTVTLHHELGRAIAKAGVADATKDAILKRGLLAEDPSEADLGLGVLFSLTRANGAAWLDALWERAIREGWGDRAEHRIVRAMPITAETWDRIAARSPQLDRVYWSSLSPFAIPGGSDQERVAAKMIEVGRAHEILGWLAHHLAHGPSGALLVRTLRAAATEPMGKRDATMFSYYAGLIFNRLEADPAVSEDEIVQLEWIYFQALCHSQRAPKTLHRALARDPKFFADLIKAIFLPAKDSDVVEPPIEDMEQARKLASQAYDVLHDWATVPGSDDSGVINGVALETWIKQARKLCSDAARGEVGDVRIGEILSASLRQPDEPWPPEPVREVIEMVRSKAVERGLEMGVYNRRGVTVRNPTDGGDQERELAQRYRRDAEALRFDWPRTAACLDRIAETYEADARRQDEHTEQRDWL